MFFAPNVTVVSNKGNVLQWQVTIGLTRANTLVPGEVMAVLTAGAPDTVLSRPVRFDLTAVGTRIAHNRSGSTGIAGIGAQIAGSLIFEGVPVS
ncbi:hypothetical protein LuPra_03961 [Luteitalea pratensis]|uniref:Uncharacterized protein n=1 Tax=Luteitalea pratensis TaxID=1855912 RepID=A0A143PQ32_LUTPR|nr:hypothetical protein [Luteitalea pratensis]AMY10722.1 hypothetical protein LuPra_03961 [Luteitalea pratensis]